MLKRPAYIKTTPDQAGKDAEAIAQYRADHPESSEMPDFLIRDELGMPSEAKPVNDGPHSTNTKARKAGVLRNPSGGRK